MPCCPSPKPARIPDQALALAVGLVAMTAAPAWADPRFLAYDPANRVTTALTRGVTLEVERGLFGALSVRRIISTTTQGAAPITRGGPDGARQALPPGAEETTVYSIPVQGDGRPLARALCPGADQTFLVLGRVRAVRPLTIQAVGLWSDGRFRHCVELSYTYRGEWALPSGFDRSGSAIPQP